MSMGGALDTAGTFDLRSNQAGIKSNLIVTVQPSTDLASEVGGLNSYT
jgi:hypothetical protein